MAIWFTRYNLSAFNRTKFKGRDITRLWGIQMGLWSTSLGTSPWGQSLTAELSLKSEGRCHYRQRWAEKNRARICVCVGPDRHATKGQRKLQRFKCFRHLNSVCGGKYVNTLLIKRSGIANATARSWPGALLMEGLGHRRSRLEWRVPRGWERRADPWRTTSACRPLTMLTVMNGESCLCISTIIYRQTAERANAGHQGTQTLFCSPRIGFVRCVRMAGEWSFLWRDLEGNLIMDWLTFVRCKIKLQVWHFKEHKWSPFVIILV